MAGRNLTSELDRICYVEELASYEKSVRICSQNQGILLPIKTNKFMKLICNKFPNLPYPDKEGWIFDWIVGLSFNSNGTAKYSDGTPYNSSTGITVKEDEKYPCSHDCQVHMSCADDILYTLPKYNFSDPFFCYRTDASYLPIDSPSTSRKCQSQTVEFKEKVVGNINLNRIFPIEKLTTYNESVQLCAERNATLLPIKTVDELLFVCEHFPQIPYPTKEGYSYFWRVGLNFMENGTRIWADGSTYNPVTDNVHVDKEKHSCSHDCQVTTWCWGNKLYTYPISKTVSPSLCYKMTEQTTVFPTNGSVISTSNLPPLIDIRSSNLPLTICLTAASSVLLSLIFFLLFCRRKRRQKRRQRLGNERFVFNANTESLDAEFGDREFLLRPEKQQDEDDEDSYITPNPVNRQDLEKCGGRDVPKSHGNNENQTRDHRSCGLPVIPQIRRHDEDSNNEEVRIVDGRKRKVEVDVHVDPFKQQLEEDDVTLHNNDVITTSNPTTSSCDVASGKTGYF